MPEPLVPAKIFDLVPGANFQDYRLLERIGVGGQGVVWSAFDPQRKQVIAIKFNEIPETEQGKIDDLLIERQAGVLIKLRHPHLLPVYAIGASGGLRYFVSPYIEGGPLECKQTFSIAEKFRLPLFQPEKLNAEAVARIAGAKPDLIAVSWPFVITRVQGSWKYPG